MQIFRNREHQEQFDRDGAICLPALQAEQIAELTEMYGKVKPLSHPGIYSNVQDQPAALNHEIAELMTRHFAPFIKKHFMDATVAGCSYLVKQNNAGSQSQLHQDYSLVNEPEFLSLSIWCPLVDVDENNGCLQVVLGTHRMFNTIRSVNIPSLYLEFDQRLQKHLTPFPIKAGTAVVYAHSLFHGSKPNFTDNIRIATAVSVVHKDAEQVHYIKNDEHIEVIRVEPKFYYETLPAFRTEGMRKGIETLRTLPLSTDTTLSVEDFYLGVDKQKKKKGFLKGLAERLLGN